MVWRRVIAALPLLLVVVHAGDELTEAARRERTSRLRSQAATWYASRKSLVSKCTRCEGVGKVNDVTFVNGRAFGESITCPTCQGRCKVVLENHYRKVFFELMTPRYRLEFGGEREIEKGFEAASEGSAWPASLDGWIIDRVQLADATHGVVWAKLNGEKTATPMRWIWTDESNGKPKWFVYNDVDGPWPGGWKEPFAVGGSPELEEIDWNEWLRRAEGARAKGTTTLAKVDALKAEAAKVLVVEILKIVDVEPLGDGAKIVVCRLWGGPWRTSLEVTKDELPLVKDWGRWDRLTCRVRVVVNGAAETDVGGEILWDGPETAAWSKNPGLGGHEIDPAEPSSFPEWCARFDAADAGGRKAMLRQVRGKTLVDDAQVVGRRAGEVSVRFGNGEVATFPLDDPQVDEAVQVGDTIVVARWPDNLDVGEADASRENLWFRFGVLERKAGQKD